MSKCLTVLILGRYSVSHGLKQNMVSNLLIESESGLKTIMKQFISENLTSIEKFMIKT